MRPLRFLLTLFSFVVAFFFLLFSGPWGGSQSQELDERGNMGSYFNWRTPWSLFSPSAIISITDDNSTNFVARPANFGPLLPSKSLTGQLWIGSGFGDDHMGRGEGELGCSDVPGWDDGSWTSASTSGKKSTIEYVVVPDSSSPLAGNGKRSLSAHDDDDDVLATGSTREDDGTDDHLHHPLLASDGLKTSGDATAGRKKPTHADIQSLQESAEIAGKIVLLSRGGCGFLEKVKWVQRRGGIAVIVGDDIRGAPLITMYARGDTSNVTIPSLFTSHTTAQLLSSLMPSGSLTGAVDDAYRQGLALARKHKVDGNGSRSPKVNDADKPNFTTTTSVSRPTPTAKTNSRKGKNEKASKKQEKGRNSHRGWFSFLFGSNAVHSHDSRRPPSSGNIGWIVQNEFDDNEPGNAKLSRPVTSTTSTLLAAAATPWKGPSDGFQIGVQDWRDPDLVAEQKENLLRSTATATSSSSSASKSTKAAPTSLKGGSITPGSGSYGKASHEVVDMASYKEPGSVAAAAVRGDGEQPESSRGWFGRLLNSDDDEDIDAGSVQQQALRTSDRDSHDSKIDDYDRKHHLAHAPQIHEGLWVTLSPASMSSSPLFDTLLVLVVSPLVTLTVVYALLLLRSRIRRRRWRAPKSVVERLPVRTYQTMPSGSASSTPSVTSTPATATTPLLTTASRLINARPRPRARTTPPVPEPSSVRSDEMASPSLDQIEEKRAAGLAEWRRRYGGKQKECVVCLEEYVDGVSRVMSLPCGHEFHAECITPWLTTRRRTCPICKGDVVRSLARSAGSSSSPPNAHHYPEHESDDEEDIQEQAVTTVNDDPSAQQPVSREDEAFEDLERGMAPDRTR